MKTSRLVLGFCFSCLSLLSVIHPAHAQLDDDLRSDYQQAMSVYTEKKAQLDRDNQLFNRGSSISFEAVIDSAKTAFAARRDAVLAYMEYLNSTAQRYISDQDAFDSLSTRLVNHYTAITEAPVAFQDINGWLAADQAFSSAYAEFNATAYQVFAYIYWSELDNIIEDFITLYQAENQSILSHAPSQIERERRAGVLAQIERSLANMRSRINQLQEQLPTIDSHEKFVALRSQLNSIYAECQTSLQTYIALE
ncbi:hypothetical protein IJJ27_01575 [bacterium]|nr:hypothetical protein [bacterium]MBQ6436234.1 hypothetical protein [bacterium]